MLWTQHATVMAPLHCNNSVLLEVNTDHISPHIVQWINLYKQSGHVKWLVRLLACDKSMRQTEIGINDWNLCTSKQATTTTYSFPPTAAASVTGWMSSSLWSAIPPVPGTASSVTRSLPVSISRPVQKKMLVMSMDYLYSVKQSLKLNSCPLQYQSLYRQVPEHGALLHFLAFPHP